jgi:hypothetical protein
MKPDVWMIQIPDNPISMYYRGRIEESWKDYNLKFFNAITPENNTKTYLNFGLKHGRLEFTSTEKAVWYSHVELWAKARNKPILIIEHDAMLLEPIPDDVWENDVVCLGHTGRNKSLLPCLAYYLKPEMATIMVNGVKTMLGEKKITFQPDASLSHTVSKFGIVQSQYVMQIQNKKIGTTIEHSK